MLACVGFHIDLFDMWEDILSSLYNIIGGQHYFCLCYCPLVSLEMTFIYMMMSADP